MPKTQTLGDMLKLGDLPLEQKEQISDAIKYSAEHESEFFTKVNHAKLDANKTSMIFMRSYLPKIDKSSDRYINGLIEGITPDPEQINEAEFSVSVMENGWYYKFTNKAVNHAWLDIKARCSKFLGNIFRTYHDEKIADAYLLSANVVTGLDPLKYEDLLRLGTILYMNGGSGEKYFVSAPDVIDAMIVKYKDILEVADKNRAVHDGEVGKVADIHLVKSRLQAFAKVSTNFPFICYCQNQSGEYPVTMCAYDNMAEDIILTPLGGLGNDPLKQRGAIGLYVDGHGFYVSDDGVCVRGVIAASTLTTLSSLTGSNLGTDHVFDDSARSAKSADGGAREVVPNYDYIKMFRYSGSSGTTANTFTLTAKKGDGTAWVFGSSATNLNSAVVAGTAVSVSGATVTTAGTGIATIKLFSVDNPKIVTFVVVEVIAGNSNGVNPVLD